MAKGRKGSAGGRATSGPNAAGPEALLEELSAKARTIATIDAQQQGPAWGEVHRMLLRTSADRAEIGRIVARRDAGELLRMLAELRGDEAAEDQETIAPDADADMHAEENDTGEAALPSSNPSVDDETMKKAMRAFRKRMKLTRLDHESRLGVGPLSGGKKADIDAIMAPREFPDEVWEALAEAGQLRRAGRGFYMLPLT